MSKMRADWGENGRIADRADRIHETHPRHIPVYSRPMIQPGLLGRGDPRRKASYIYGELGMSASLRSDPTPDLPTERPR